MRNRIPRNEKDVTLNKPPSNPMAVHIGLRIRKRRLILELTQEQLARKLGTIETEIEKYESGTIRVDACQIFELSQALGVPLSFFFADEHEAAPVSEARNSKSRELAGRGGTVAKPEEASELVATFQQIPEFAVRMCVLDFIRSLVPRKPAEAEFRAAQARNAPSLFVRLATMSRDLHSL